VRGLLCPRHQRRSVTIKSIEVGDYRARVDEGLGVPTAAARCAPARKRL
jgi:hypothetical protein